MIILAVSLIKNRVLIEKKFSLIKIDLSNHIDPASKKLEELKRVFYRAILNISHFLNNFLFKII